jgi:hypothetical protein
LMEGVANHLDFDDVLHSSSRNQKRTAQKHNRKSEAYVGIRRPLTNIL